MEGYLIGAMAAAIVAPLAFFIGSMTSPHAKSFKQALSVWQGNYSTLKKQYVALTTEIEDQDPIVSILKQVGVPEKMIPLVKPIAEQKLAEFLNSAANGEKGDAGKSTSLWGK